MRSGDLQPAGGAVVELWGVVHNMRVDLLTRNVSTAFAAAGIPHVLLEGPTTSSWLYEPPRAYADVDILLRLADMEKSRRVVTDRGLATVMGGGVGEEASHSLVMQAPSGIELDLHLALPMLKADTADTVWAVLQQHVVDFDIDGHSAADDQDLGGAAECSLGNSDRDCLISSSRYPGTFFRTLIVVVDVAAVPDPFAPTTMACAGWALRRPRH